MACSSGKQACGKICFLLPTRMYLLNNPGEFTVLLPYQILALVQRETADEVDGFVVSFCFLEIINCNDEGSGRGNKVFLNGVFLWEAKMKKCWAAFPLRCYPALLSVLHCCSGQGCPHWVPALPAGTWG